MLAESAAAGVQTPAIFHRYAAANQSNQESNRTDIQDYFFYKWNFFKVVTYSNSSYYQRRSNRRSKIDWSADEDLYQLWFTIYIKEKQTNFDTWFRPIRHVWSYISRAVEEDEVAKVRTANFERIGQFAYYYHAEEENQLINRDWRLILYRPPLQLIFPQKLLDPQT